MSLYLINIPRPVPLSDYKEATQLLISRLSGMDGLVSIIGFGNVSSPGISDIDLLAVFADGQHATFDSAVVLPPHLRYLVTHNVAAMCLSHFRRTARFTTWHKHDTLWGEDIAADYRHAWQPGELEALKVQTALEFLITNYIDMTVQTTYRIIKLRSLLQHVKALKFDLDFLDVGSGPVYDGIEEVRHWIQHWFEIDPHERAIEPWLAAFMPAYERFMNEAFARDGLFLPRRETYRISANTTLRSAATVGHRHAGFVFPSVLGRLGRKFFNLQHRCNRFEFCAPIVHSHPVALISERYAFFQEIMEYHRRHFGRFITLLPTLAARVA